MLSKESRRISCWIPKGGLLRKTCGKRTSILHWPSYSNSTADKKHPRSHEPGAFFYVRYQLQRQDIDDAQQVVIDDTDMLNRFTEWRKCCFTVYQASHFTAAPFQKRFHCHYSQSAR